MGLFRKVITWDFSAWVMADHLAKLKGLWQKAAWLKTVEKIVEGVEMKCHFPEALFLKVMPSNFIEMGWNCVVESSVCIWWSAWQTFLVGTIYATQISVCMLVPWVKWILQEYDLLHTGLYLCFWCSWLEVKCFWHGPCKWGVGYVLFWCKDYPT